MTKSPYTIVTTISCNDCQHKERVQHLALTEQTLEDMRSARRRVLGHVTTVHGDDRETPTYRGHRKK